MLYNINQLGSLDGLEAWDRSGEATGRFGQATAVTGHYALATDMTAASIPNNWPITGALTNSGEVVDIVYDYYNDRVTIDTSAAFSGVMTGLGHSIDLGTSMPLTTVFGVVGINTGTVRDIGVTGFASLQTFGGGVVGINEGVVANAYSAADLVGGAWTGGLVGYNKGVVTGSIATGDLNGFHLTGGLVGGNAGYVGHSKANGSVLGAGVAGGLVGRNLGHITDSAATGTVKTHATVFDSRAGGLVGHNGTFFGSAVTPTISNSYATGAVEGRTYAGGLIGQDANGRTVNSHATGDVVLTGESGRSVGGLIGHGEGVQLVDVHATGAVRAAQIAPGGNVVAFSGAGGLAAFPCRHEKVGYLPWTLLDRA